MTQPIKNTFFEVDIHTLSHDGRGIAHIEGKATFVEGALADETVRIEITKKHRNYQEAKTLEVIHSSPERATPLCPHFGVCGGCSMQHLEGISQIQFKQKALLEQLQLFGKVTPLEILPPLSGKPWGYRRRARIGVKYVKKKGRLLIGFREKMSRYLADLKRCLVLDPKVGERFEALNQLISTLTQFEHIPQIEVAIGDHETALVFRHLTDLPDNDLAQLIAFGKTYEFSIYLQPNQPAPVRKLWPENASDLLTYTLQDNITMSFHPLDFVQVNGEINQALINQAIALLDPQPHETVLDLFCGLGNFTLPLARRAKQVTGVEGSQEMVQRAQMNAANNHFTNAHFYVENLANPAPNSPWLQSTYDKILLDPPRTGAKELIPLLGKLSPQRIVYVSCNPATLARDAGELTHQLGYIITKVGVVNMFPHTSHIEAIAVFEKSSRHGQSQRKISTP